MCMWQLRINTLVKYFTLVVWFLLLKLLITSCPTSSVRQQSYSQNSNALQYTHLRLRTVTSYATFEGMDSLKNVS